MRVIEGIAEILKREGVEFFPCFPDNALIDAAASIGIRPIICRQERVGVGIADGFSRVSNGKRLGVFAMQQGPGSENSFAGVATAYADSTPILILPIGHRRSRAQVPPIFNSARSYPSVTKSIETINDPLAMPDAMRRALAQVKLGRVGPVMVEVPADVAQEEIEFTAKNHRPARRTISAASEADVESAAKELVTAQVPIMYAGQGVLYSEATDSLIELAELLQAPVMTTLLGKSAFPENHPLSLGTGAVTAPGPVMDFLKRADLVFAVGSSLTKYATNKEIPVGKKLIHATNDARDMNKDYSPDVALLGDAKLVLEQLSKAVRSKLGKEGRRSDGSVRKKVKRSREAWLKEWVPKLTSAEVPINPYRVVWEFMQAVDPSKAIVTHDAGSPRDQMVPFYVATRPRSYIGWGKSHQLGTGLGLIMGAKLAAPDKFCVNFMGDAAFGMTGLDFETAVRSSIPITTIVLNNSTMAMETETMPVSHKRYGSRDLGGDYSAIGKALGGVSVRVEDPDGITESITLAMKENVRGKSVLLEFITSEETSLSHQTP
jgi:acetolactate synthase I/II/III large subunit